MMFTYIYNKKESQYIRIKNGLVKDYIERYCNQEYKQFLALKYHKNTKTHSVFKIITEREWVNSSPLYEYSTFIRKIGE